MTDKNSDLNHEDHQNIEKILQERERLDRILKDRFTKEMTIVFSDVSGYTRYMDTWGDIRGRAWIQKHHDIVFPIIEAHEGVVLDVMGDGLMIAFGETRSAVNAAVAAQKALADYNTGVNDADELHIHVGINFGRILMDGDHIAGDVVNVASRIQSQAVADEILISKTVYEAICGSDDILCRFHKRVEVKGKTEALELYRVVWGDEDTVISAEPLVRGEKEAIRRPIQPRRPVFHLDVSREEDRLQISAYEQIPGETSTVSHYEDVPVSMDAVNDRCRDIVDVLNRVNRSGRISKETLIKLRSIGQVFSDELFSTEAKDRLAATAAEHLVLSIDDRLVQIPWELFHDGQKFLCQKFSMGRRVRTRHSVAAAGKNRVLARPIRMLIVADPNGDLKGAYQEGKRLVESIDQFRDYINATLRSDDITPGYIKEKIRNFDLVHYAGHSDYHPEDPAESGWRLSSGILQAGDIRRMAGTGVMPALIFSNACQSARTEEWGIRSHFQDDIFGLANAFLLAGVKHFVGTFWEILDEPSSRFALQFYSHLLSGLTVGEAVRQARLDLIDEYGEETIVWGSYLLYGDPSFNYAEQIQAVEYAEDTEAEEPGLSPIEAAEVGVRAGEEIVDFADTKPRPRRRILWAAVILLAALIGVGLWVYPRYQERQIRETEDRLRTLYARGEYDAAETVSREMAAQHDKLRVPHVIQGNIALRRGDLAAAEAAFKRGFAASRGTDVQKADALIGLGCVASLGNHTDAAMDYYRQASTLNPESGRGYVAQAVLRENAGDYNQALVLLKQARSVTPDDPTVAALLRETEKRAATGRDAEQQERIDRLVKELLQRAKEPPRASPWDGWTSRPLTLWVMELQTDGRSLNEGEGRLITAGLTEALIDGSRVQPVERAILDKLLEEMKLGTSELADRNTALTLGRILAARLILTGRLVHSGPDTQASLRLIETETGRIQAAVSETFPGVAPPSLVTKKLAPALIVKLDAVYPLRGKITAIEGTDVTINIGSGAGVQIGQKFTVSGTGATLEAISTGPDQSLAKVVSGKKEIAEGLRVEAVNN